MAPAQGTAAARVGEGGGGGVAPFLGCEAVAQLGDRFAAADEILELPAPSNTFETRMETYVG